MEDDKKRRRRRRLAGFGVCCFPFLIAIILISTLVPTLAFRSTTDDTNSTNVTTTMIDTTTSSSGTTGGTTTSGPTTTTAVETTSPAFSNPVYRFFSSNMMDYSQSKNKFVNFNFTIDELPIKLVVTQTDVMGVVDWQTKHPVFPNYMTFASISLAWNCLTIDQNTNDIYIVTLCHNASSPSPNATTFCMFKFDTNGIFKWQTYLSNGVLVHSGRFLIHNQYIYYAKGNAILATTPMLVFKIDTITGNVVNVTSVSSGCPGNIRTGRPELLNDNVTLIFLSTTFPSPFRYCVIRTDLNLNVQSSILGDVLPTLSADILNNIINKTDGSFYAISPDYFTYYNTSANLIFSNISTNSSRVYIPGPNPSSIDESFVKHNGAYYAVVTFRVIPTSISPQTVTLQLLKVVLENNTAQLGPEILLQTYPTYANLSIAERYTYTTPTIYNGNYLAFLNYTDIPTVNYGISQLLITF